MKLITKAALAGASALALTTITASADIVCNHNGDCWHVNGRADYKPELKIRVHPDNWKFSDNDHYRWREHTGRGYWRGGVWIDL